MSQLQEDPSDKTTECYEKTAAVNAQILSIFDVELYILEGVSRDKVGKQFEIAYDKLQQELKECVTQESLLLYGLPRA